MKTKLLLFAGFQFGGLVLVLGLLISTIVGHVLYTKNDDADDELDSGVSRNLVAIFVTSSYAAVGVYILATAAFILFILVQSSWPVMSAIFLLLYSAIDTCFMVCAGGAFIGSLIISFDNGGGIAMMSCLLFLLALKIFPMMMIKFNVFSTLSLIKQRLIPLAILKLLGVAVVVIGTALTLTYAVIELIVAIRVLYHDTDVGAINLMFWNTSFFFIIVLLASFGCLIALKDRLTAYTVDVFNFFTPLFLGFNLNLTINTLYFFRDYKDSQTQDKKTISIFYATQIALTVVILLMCITSICVSFLRPFLQINGEKELESKNCIEQEESSAEHAEPDDTLLVT